MAKRNRRGKHWDNSVSAHLTARYDVAVKMGREVVEGLPASHSGKFPRIYWYYSRPEIQQAIFDYAKGRKITVLRHFKSLYKSFEQPEDILYLAIYHALHSKLWPSFHGMVSRTSEDTKVCDFVIEVDNKHSWKRCFEATKPVIDMLNDFGVHSYVKFSGHASAHVIIPGEIFPGGGMGGAGYRSELMKFVGKLVKGERLDRSFTNPSHFLRLAYSINENTGLVSIPIPIEDFDHFAWNNAKPENVEVLEGWWGYAPVDAQERMKGLLDFLKKERFDVGKKEAAKQFQKVDRFQAVKTKTEGVVRFVQLLQPTDKRLYEGMLKTAREHLDWVSSIEENADLKAALDEVRLLAQNSIVLSLTGVSRKHEIDLKEFWKAWRWELKSGDIKYYFDPLVQKDLFEATQNRNVKLGEDGPVVRIENQGDVFLLALFMNMRLGTNEHPSFYRSLAWGSPGRPLEGWDVAIQSNGRGDRAKAIEAMREAVSAISEPGIQTMVFDEGISTFTCVISNHEKKEDLLKLIKKQINTRMKSPEAVKLLDETSFALVPCSLNPFTGKPCVLIPIEKEKAFS